MKTPVQQVSGLAVCMAWWLFAIRWRETDHHEGLIRIVLTSRLQGRGGAGGVGLPVSGVAEAQAVEEVGGEAGEAGAVRVSLWKYVVIYVWFILLFRVSKKVSIRSQSCSRHLLEFRCPYHRRGHVVKEVKSILRSSDPFCQPVWCRFVFPHRVFYVLFPIVWHWFVGIHLYPAIFCSFL